MQLTETQERILKAVSELNEERGYPATYREVQERSGVASTESVYTHIRFLKEQGLVLVDDTVARSIRVPKNEGAMR
jgi:SOS-response transcriptional repressor LexA